MSAARFREIGSFTLMILAATIPLDRIGAQASRDRWRLISDEGDKTNFFDTRTLASSPGGRVSVWIRTRYQSAQQSPHGYFRTVLVHNEINCGARLMRPIGTSPGRVGHPCT